MSTQPKHTLNAQEAIEKEFSDAISELKRFEELLFGTIPPKSIEDIPNLSPLAAAVLLKVLRESNNQCIYFIYDCYCQY